MPDQEQNQNQTPKPARRPSSRELEGKTARIEAKLKKIEDQKLELAASLEATKKLLAERKDKEDRKARTHRLIIMGEVFDKWLKNDPEQLKNLIVQAKDQLEAKDSTKKEKADAKILLEYFNSLTPGGAQG